MLNKQLTIIKNKLYKKLMILEEKKAYAEGRKFDKICDEQYAVKKCLEDIDKITYWQNLDKNKYKVVVVEK